MLLEERFVFLDNSWTWETLHPKLLDYAKLIILGPHTQEEREVFILLRDGSFWRRKHANIWRLYILSRYMRTLKVPSTRCTIKGRTMGFLVGEALCQFKYKDSFLIEKVPCNSISDDYLFKGKL